jgi:hypothetical protein
MPAVVACLTSETARSVGEQQDSYACVASWIKSPRPLNDLKSEPTLPKPCFSGAGDDGCQVWVDGEQLTNNERT